VRRLLIVGPAFHGLWQGIEAAFRQIGYDAHSHCYDDFGTLSAKLRNKVGHELPQRLGRASRTGTRDDLTAGAVAALADLDPELVIVIKADVIGPAFWDALDDRRTPRLLWLYDALTSMSYDAERMSRADQVVSFSRTDVAQMAEWGLPAHHMHLGFDSLLPLPDLPPRREVVFAGARYPGREALFVDLLARGVPIRAFGRQWSRHPWDRLRTWDVRRPKVPAGRDLDRATACARMRAATAAVNMHGPQDGFNLRVFEACGVGGVQILDRDDVAELYDPGTEVAVFHSTEELVELCRRAEQDHTWATGLRTRAAERTAAEHTFVHRARHLESLWA
jgi:spore maturation protein CgeB